MKNDLPTGQLGRTLEDAFSSFEAEAFAAASLGQVHRAADGKGLLLAVKLQYPGIDKTIESDLGLLPIFEMMGSRVKFRNPYEW